MELDHLKNLWNKDELPEIPEISLEKQKEIHLPLEKIRKNMRMEFWSTFIFLIGVFIFIWILPLAFKYKFYLTVLIGSMVLVTSFFFSRFFRLYKEIESPIFNTSDSLKDLLYQFNLNKQYYVSFYLSFVPFLVCELIIVNEFLPYNNSQSNTYLAIWFLVSVFIGLVLLYLLGNWWFNYFYGKHIKKIEKLIEELK